MYLIRVEKLKIIFHLYLLVFSSSFCFHVCCILTISYYSMMQCLFVKQKPRNVFALYCYILYSFASDNAMYMLSNSKGFRKRWKTNTFADLIQDIHLAGPSLLHFFQVYSVRLFFSLMMSLVEGWWHYQMQSKIVGALCYLI